MGPTMGTALRFPPRNVRGLAEALGTACYRRLDVRLRKHDHEEECSRSQDVPANERPAIEQRRGPQMRRAPVRRYSRLGSFASRNSHSRPDSGHPNRCLSELTRMEFECRDNSRQNCSRHTVSVRCHLEYLRLRSTGTSSRDLRTKRAAAVFEKQGDVQKERALCAPEPALRSASKRSITSAATFP
jgi:hypothetical protein